VLRPIEDRELQKASGAKYYLSALSPKDSNGRYCLALPPDEIGLRIDKADIVAGDGGASCFKAALLTARDYARGQSSVK
jgi:hypothetical protein